MQKANLIIMILLLSMISCNNTQNNNETEIVDNEYTIGGSTSHTNCPLGNASCGYLSALKKR